MTTIRSSVRQRLVSLIQPLHQSHDEFRAETEKRFHQTAEQLVEVEKLVATLMESVLHSRWLSTPDYLASRKEAGHWLNWLGLAGEGVEIGVFRGEYSRDILRAWKGTRLTSVDPWKEFPASEYVDSCNLSQEEHERNLAATRHLLAPFQERSRILRTTSDEAAREFANRSLDFVYLDAQHHYEAVRNDIATWLPKLKKGGVLGGHDYLDGRLPSGEYGVKRAVTEFSSERNWPVVVTHEPDWPSWYVRVG